MRLMLVVLLAMMIAPSFAQAPVAPPAKEEIPITDLDLMVVSGAQPGPGMWKVTKGDHVLWILGTLSPLPKKMEWQSRDVEAVIAQAQEVLSSPGVALNVKIGFFQGLMLAPKLIGIRKNPGGASLQQKVPADMYARWLPLKRKYIGNDHGIETWRPLFAAIKLYDDAIAKSGLTKRSDIDSVIKAAIKRNKVKVTAPMVKLVIDDPKAAVNEFRASSMDDVECFDKTMRRLETDLDTMVARANAWAVGDIATLRQLPHANQMDACVKATTEAGFARKRGFGDIDARVQQLWLTDAEAALAKNHVTFATLEMPELLRPGGYLASLQARGYSVEAP